MRVLVIEDDPMIGRGLKKALQDENMSVDVVGTAADGEHAISLGDHQLVLLDIGLPDGSGFEILSNVRKAGVKTPIIVLTARDAIDDLVSGLELGADDYMVKPFATRELVARMKTVLRRQGQLASQVLEADGLSLDLERCTLSIGAESIVLPSREFNLMRLLMERPGIVYSRTQIEDRLYGWNEEVESNAVDALIYTIRRKAGKHVIRNIRGVGWMVPKVSGS